MKRLSVIIPTFNRPDLLSVCLESFIDLDYPDKDWELILVNDGGDRSFSTITTDILDQLPLTLIDIEHGGPAKARNAGAEIAQGEFLVFTDDDCRVDKNWLRAFEGCFANSTFVALGGKILNSHPGSVPAKTWSRYMDYLREEVMQDSEGNLLLLLGNNLAYRRKIFQEIGGFNEEFPFAAAEDSELGIRLVGTGYRQTFCPEAIIWHDHPITYGGYLRQQFRYGRGNHYFLEIVGAPDYPYVERSKGSFTASLRKLLDYSRKIRASTPMKLLFLATPLAFKAGNLYEKIRVQLLQSRDPRATPS